MVGSMIILHRLKERKETLRNLADVFPEKQVLLAKVVPESAIIDRMETVNRNQLFDLLDKAVRQREGDLADEHTGAVRLFNGFYEGFPQLVLDLYGTTLVLQDHSKRKEERTYLEDVETFFIERYPWISCMIRKVRHSDDRNERN